MDPDTAKLTTAAPVNNIGCTVYEDRTGFKLWAGWLDRRQVATVTDWNRVIDFIPLPPGYEYIVTSAHMDYHNDTPLMHLTVRRAIILDEPLSVLLK